MTWLSELECGDGGVIWRCYCVCVLCFFFFLNVVGSISILCFVLFSFLKIRIRVSGLDRVRKT